MDTEPGFRQRMEGKFEGIMHWEQLDVFWPRVLQSTTPWYLYQLGFPAPNTALSTQEITRSVKELDALIREEHDQEYCGIVYADDIEQPTLIKVYDPNNLGSSCGCSGDRVLPRWIISQQLPEEIADSAPTPNKLKCWWNTLFR